MSRIYIIEGPDACGKTTLIGSEAFMGMPKYHQGPYDGDPLAQTVDMIHTRCNLSKEWASDRLHYGERVYGPIIRNIDRLGPTGLRFIDRILRTHDTIVVTCLPPFEVALQSFLETAGGQLPKVQQYESVYNAYRDGHHSPSKGIPHIEYDYTQTTSSELLLAMEHLNTWRPRERFHATGVGVGPFKKGHTLAIFDDMSVPTERTLHMNLQLELYSADESKTFWSTTEAVYAYSKSLIELEPKVVIACEDSGLKAVREALLPTFRASGRQAPLMILADGPQKMAWEIHNHAWRN